MLWSDFYFSEIVKVDVNLEVFVVFDLVLGVKVEVDF